MQQPLLTADEVIELLKEALPEDENLRNAFTELTEKHTLVCHGFFNPSAAMIELLQHCANFLSSQGVFVYLEIGKPQRLHRYCLFIAGECGRVYERLKKQVEYLNGLSLFIEDHEEELPKTMLAKKKKIENYASVLSSRLLWQLGELYRQGDKAALKSLCEEAWEFANEVDAYLDSIKDLQRLFAISLIL